MKPTIAKRIGAFLAPVGASVHATLAEVPREFHLKREYRPPVPLLLSKAKLLCGGLAAVGALLFIVATGPLSAQVQPPPAAGQRSVTLKQIGSDGTETNVTQPLGPDEGLLVQKVNGKVVSQQVIKSGASQRVIIKFKSPSLVQQFGQGLAKGQAATTQQQMEKSREGFRGRLLNLENQHRASKGQSAVTRQELIRREYSNCFHGMAAQVHQEILADIKAMPEVEEVYLDQQRKKCDGYGIGQIGAPQVWQNLGVTGSGIKIAIVDTGIDYLHPDLGGAIGPGHKVLGGYDFVNLDNDPMDDNGHGTHVAGIAAANGVIKGVAPDASLFAIKVLDAYGSGYDSDIISGIEWAVANGANIINMSLGGAGNPDDPLSQAVDQATSAGVLIVTAAGNSGFAGYNTIGSPADARTALAVGADDQNEQMAFFSSRGPAPLTYQIKPEVVAPGVGILSTVPYSGTMLSDPSGYMMLDGTSMASPHVAGAAALLLQKNPSWNASQLKLALIEGARNLNQDVMTQGSGEVNVYASATSPTLSTGGELSLGWDDLRQPTFGSNQTLTLTNTSAAPTQVSLAIQANVPAGMQVAVTPATVSLQPGESQTVSFSLNVNNAITPNLPAQPFTYGGLVTATTSTGSSLHRPFAVCKAPKLRVTADGILLSFTTLHGTDLPQPQFLFSPGPFETLMAAGSYDFEFEFYPFFTQVNSKILMESQSVVREKVDVSSFTALTISSTEAKNNMAIQPIDIQGNPLAPDWFEASSIITHATSHCTFSHNYSGPSSMISYQSNVSNMSAAFTWDGSFGGMPDDPHAPVYAFYGSKHQGITASKTFTFKPTDFNKTTLLHAPMPNNDQRRLRSWVWTILVGTTMDGLGYDSAVPFSGPLEQTFYSIPSDNLDAGGGYWSVDEVGLVPSGNTAPWLADGLVKTPAYRPVNKNLLVGYAYDFGEAVYRSGAKRLLLAEGPAHWSGSMQNQTNLIRIQTDGLQSAMDQKLFNGQCEEELVHGLLSYTLSQANQVVASGTLDQAMEFIPGLIQPYPVQMPVAPGAYDLAIPFTGFFMQGKPGQLEVINHFDTTKSDPNPPYLTEYQLINPLDLTQKSPFLDAIPVTGAELRFGAEDDVQVKDAKLSFQQGNAWLPLPLVKVDPTHYAAYIPWLGAKRNAINLKLVVSDTSGNALTMTESIPYVKK